MLKVRQALGGGPYLQRNGVSGKITSRKATRHRPSVVIQDRPTIACDGNNLSLRMAAACLHRPDCLQLDLPRRANAGDSNSSSDDGNKKASFGTLVEKLVAALSEKLEEAKSVLTSNNGSCVVVLVRRKVSVTVPRGHRVTARIWRELEASCKVTFSSEVVTTLVPSKEQCYPTPVYWAACFHTAKDLTMARKFIAEKGGGNAEWLELLAETRRTAEEGRKRHHDNQLLEEAKDDAAGLAPDEKQNEIEPEVARKMECGVVVDGGGDTGVGASGHGVGQEKPVSFFRRSNRRPPPPSQDVGAGSKGRLSSIVKALGRWFHRFRCAPRIREGSDVDRTYDWVIDVSQDSQHIV